MKKNATLILLSFLIIIIAGSCSLIFNSDENNIERQRVLQHELNDIYIYSIIDKSKTDSFTVTKYVNSYEYDEDDQSQLIRVSLNSPSMSEPYFIISVLYDFGYINFYNGALTYNADDETAEFVINGTKYKKVYVLEDDTGGDSDSTINKIKYHGKAGVLSYRYENGDEYFLDTIIKVD